MNYQSFPKGNFKFTDVITHLLLIERATVSALIGKKVFPKRIKLRKKINIDEK